MIPSSVDFTKMIASTESNLVEFPRRYDDWRSLASREQLLAARANEHARWIWSWVAWYRCQFKENYGWELLTQFRQRYKKCHDLQGWNSECQGKRCGKSSEGKCGTLSTFTSEMIIGKRWDLSTRIILCAYTAIVRSIASYWVLVRKG